MTNEEAEAMLVELTKHYRCRVAPVNRFCAALQTWAKAVASYSPDVSKAAHTVYAALGKSNLAARLVYGGEELRTETVSGPQGKVERVYVA